jgi:hypothetical protein
MTSAQSKLVIAGLMNGRFSPPDCSARVLFMDPPASVPHALRGGRPIGVRALGDAFHMVTA